MARRLGFAWLILLLAGCAAPKAEKVWVDVSAAPKPPEQKALKATAVPAGLSESTTRIAGVPARVVADPAGNDAIGLDQNIKFTQERAFRILIGRLRRIYEAETRRFAREREASRMSTENASYRELTEALRQVFEGYADKRSPAVARLALISGFPDRPRSAESLPAGKSLVRTQWEEAARLRTSLKVLEADFDLEIQRALTALDDLNAANRAALAVEVEEFRTRMDQLADKEAAAQVTTDLEDLDLQLAGRTDLKAPAVAAKSVRLPALAPPPAKARVSSPTSSAMIDLEQDLRLWIALRGYERSPVKAGARDATQEFLAWRTTFPDGRSQNSPNSSAER